MKRTDVNRTQGHYDYDEDEDDVVLFKVIGKRSSSSAEPYPTPPQPPPAAKRVVQAKRKMLKVEEEEEEEQVVVVVKSDPNLEFAVPRPVSRSSSSSITTTTGGDYGGEDIDASVLSTLGTFDKGHKSRMTEDKRLELSRQRIKQSSKTMPVHQHQDNNQIMTTIDDSLTMDPVQSLAREYEAQTSTTTAHKNKKSKSRPPPSSPQQQQQQQIQGEEEATSVFTENVFMDDDNDGAGDGEDAFRNIAKALVLPNMRVPDTGAQVVVNTLPEYLDRDNPRRMNFERALPKLRVQNQTTVVKVRNPDLIYKDVKDVLDKRLGLYQFRKYAIQNQMLIPELPYVTKVENREALWEANTAIGERPCVFGERCVSWSMCEERMKEDPERYALVTPFVCKEFYFGDRAKEIKEAQAKGIPLNEVYGIRLTMCILCHLANVRNYYMDYDLQLANAPVHVLHAFQYIVGIPGEYPLEMMLMGDNEYKGVISPFLRFCTDNYVWQPAFPDLSRLRGSSAEVVRFRRLYPQSPYTVGINTLYVPSVESTLLHYFVTKGNCKFTAAAQLVFQNTLQETVQYLRNGYHVQAKHKVATFIPSQSSSSEEGGGGGILFSVPTIETFVGKLGQEVLAPWVIPREHVLWIPRHLASFAGEIAIDYYCVIALFFRINGAHNLYQRILHEVYNKKVPVNDTVLSKVTAFIDRHMRMIQEIDGMEFPRDDALSMTDVASGGPTHYIQDAGLMQVTTYRVPLQQTPLEVLHTSGVTEMYELQEFEVPTEEAMGTISHNIRHVLTDEQLEGMFIKDTDGDEEDEGEEEDVISYRLEHYYPVRMTTPGECREHSWYLACLVMINSAYQEVKAVEDTRARPMVDKHELHVKYAFHRIMVSYVQLMLHALTPHPDVKSGVPRYRIRDDDWRPQPDGNPTLLDRFFPRDTFAFHAGDLPALESVLSQVGWCGLQVVKDKIPLVKIFMKSLPVCCQCRDLVSALLTECRAPKSEGFWRVVRAMFWCSFAGLYPHSRERPNFRSLMFVYDLLFNRKECFLAALEHEMLLYKEQEAKRKASGGGGGNGNKKKKSTTSAASSSSSDEDNNQTSRLVFTVFREFFVHSMRNDHAWLERIQKKIDWKKFVVVTLNTADKMRKYGMFGDAPSGNELMFAIDAVWRETSGSSKQVYRYKKQTYEQLLQSRMNAVQDRLHEKKLEIDADIAMTRYILERIGPHHQTAMDKSDIFSIYGHVNLVREFGKVDPMALYESDPARFTQVVRGVMSELSEKYSHLSCVIDPQIKSNIMMYLMRVEKERRFQFDVLLDARLGGVEHASVQALYRTQQIYATRSSPKSITMSIENMPVRDIRIIAWYFNILNRLGDISLFPLDLYTVNRQVAAMRNNRFRLMDDEPVPEHAWNVYVTICCGRITTFADQSTVGNLRMSYNIATGNYVCNKKMGRTMKAKVAAAAAAAQNAQNIQQDVDEEDCGGDDECEIGASKKRPRPSTTTTTKPKQSSASTTSKRAQTDRKNDSFLSCDNQPVMCINIFGHALAFGGEKYLFCPRCAQFHTYSPLGWNKGYECGACRAKEVNKAKLKQCAFCKKQDRTEFGNPVELIVLDKDPCNPGFDPATDPMRCFQCLYMCRQDMGSMGVFERVPIKRLYTFTPKEDLWEIIQPNNTERMLKNARKFGR